MRHARAAVAMVLAAAMVLVVGPGAAYGTGATVGASSGSQVWASGHASAPTTDPITGWPVPHWQRDVYVGDVSQVIWEKSGTGPKQYFDWDEGASSSAAWMMEVDPLGTWDTSDDVWTEFYPTAPSPPFARYSKGGRTASMHGTIPGTLMIWNGNRMSGPPDWTQRPPDVVRPTILTIDVEWTAAETLYASRENSRTAGEGYFEIMRNAGTQYQAAACGRVVSDDGRVLWDGPFTEGNINHWSGQGVVKGEAPAPPPWPPAE